jgi:hypothetical protein
MARRGHGMPETAENVAQEHQVGRGRPGRLRGAVRSSARQRPRRAASSQPRSVRSRSGAARSDGLGRYRRTSASRHHHANARALKPIARSDGTRDRWQCQRGQ